MYTQKQSIDPIDSFTPLSLGGYFDQQKDSPVPKLLSDSELEELARTSNWEDDEIWDDMTRTMLRQSCAFFAQEVLLGPQGPPYYGRFFIAEHHEEWNELIDTQKRICVLAPRDHGKSFFFSKAYPIWKAKYEPGSVGYIFSESKDQAIDILRRIKEEIEQNPLLQNLIPDTRGTRKTSAWGETKIKLSNGSRIYAKSFGTKSRGAHPDWIIVDDGVGDDAATSETIRTKQSRFFKSAITNMIIPGGQIIVVGTPQHAQDLYGELSENTQYKFVQYKAVQDDGSPLWPERYNKASLDAKLEEIGTLIFTREFQTSPVSDSASLFPMKLFRGDPVEQKMATLGLPLKYWKDRGIVGVYMGVDFARSAETGADYTVVFVLGLDANQNRWILNIRRGKGLPYQHQLSIINEEARKYNADLIFCEANQMQALFGEELIRTTDLPIKQFTTTTEKHSLEKGVPSLRILFENGKFRIPRGDAHSIETTNVLIDEMHALVWDDGVKSTAKHDDCPMALWIADQACRVGTGFTMSFGDGYGNEDPRKLMAELTGQEFDEDAEKKTFEQLIKEYTEGKGANDGFVDNFMGNGPILGAPNPMDLLRYK